ncbi:MAG: sugar isomerase domain-containing protein [Clostridia bacterium]|nr:sugar isomerase domain-containing protein [Clostridia bacterium]
METEKFSNIVRELLDNIDKNQQEAMDKASALIYESMKNGGLFHIFCTGHSHMIAEEFFYRAGGLIPVNPLLMPFLMQHEGAVSSTKFERLSGVAKIIFDGAEIRKGEPILIASNSGINAVPIEMAMLAKENGTLLNHHEYLLSTGKILAKISNWTKAQYTTLYSVGYLDQLLSYVDKAYAIIEPLKTTDPTLYQTLYERINLESLMPRFVQVQYFTTEYTAAELLALRKQFLADCDALRVTHGGENTNVTIAQYKADWGIS